MFSYALLILNNLLFIYSPRTDIIHMYAVMVHSFKFMHIIHNIIVPKIQHVRILYRRENLLLDYPKRLDSWIFNK